VLRLAGLKLFAGISTLQQFAISLPTTSNLGFVSILYSLTPNQQPKIPNSLQLCHFAFASPTHSQKNSKLNFNLPPRATTIAQNTNACKLANFV